MSDRYIIIKAFVDSDYDRIIPPWDQSITYAKHYCHHDGQQISLKDVVFDIKTKELFKGIEIDLYPKDVSFIVGEEVYAETSIRNKDNFCTQKAAYKSTIVDIVYQQYDEEIIKGSKLEKYRIEQMIEQCKEFELDMKALYWLKYWKPYFILSNKEVIKSHYDLFKILEK